MVNLPRRNVLIGTGGVLGSAAAFAPGVAAAVAPPATVPLLATYVAGTAHRAEASDAVACLRPGDALALRRVPDSAYDPRTVEVLTADGVRLGALPRIDNQAVANLMDAGFRLTARVRAVRPDPVRPELDVEIAMAPPTA